MNWDQHLDQLNSTIAAAFNETAAAIYHPASGVPLEVSGDFEAPGESGGDQFGHATYRVPSWTMDEAEAPAWSDGDLLDYNGTTYRVRPPVPDGGGRVTYDLWDFDQ